MTSGPPTTQARARVLALLPVFNGARFLREQLDSILGQSWPDVVVLLRDDGSTDESPAIVQDYKDRYPERIFVIEDARGNLGASGSFSLLMEAALSFEPAPAADDRPLFYALADQDDIWREDKLEQEVLTLLDHEQRKPRVPALVHSDLRVVTEEGRVIAGSMARYQGLQPERSGFAAQLLSNTVTGCTTVMNRALLVKGLPVPPQAIMHDWWLSLVASAFGNRYYLDEPLVDYRQHGRNTIGAKAWEKPTLNRRLLRRLFGHDHQDIFEKNARQARRFRRQYRRELTVRQRAILALATALSWPIPPFQKFLYRTLRRL